MQNFISFLMVLIFFENFEKKIIVRRANPNYTKFGHLSLGEVDTLIIKI